MPLTTNHRLANAYDDAAEHIETRPEDYNFGTMASCNCGILAQHLLGISWHDLWARTMMRVFPFPTWACARRDGICPQTGLPLNTLLRELAQAGCTPQELADLENVGSDRAKVVAYMRRRARELRAECEAVRVIEVKAETKRTGDYVKELVR
jgi:hypothetical protein